MNRSLVNKRLTIFFLSPWFATFFLFTISSIFLYQWKKSIVTFNLGSLLYSIFISFIFWLFLGLLRGVFKRRTSKLIFSGALGILIPILLIASFIIYDEFRIFISRDIVIDAIYDPEYFLIYLKSFMVKPEGLGLFALILLFGSIWYPRKNILRLPKNKKSITLLVLMPLFLLAFLNDIRHTDASEEITMDTSFLLGLKRSIEPVKKGRLHISYNRLKPKEFFPQEPYNIVLIISESWNKEALQFYGYPQNPTPFLSNRISKERDRFFVFDYFYSQSGNTDVSVPSIATGVASFEPNEKLHKMPLLWDWARAAGYQTMMVSAQQMTWQSLFDFLFVVGPDKYYTATEIDAPFVNDIGIDDLEAMTYFEKVLDSFSKDRPFLAVFGNNAVHGPYQQTSPHLEVQPSYPTRFENALFILDKGFEAIYRKVEELGKLDRTIFIFTSDHCTRGSRIPRIFSFYEEALNIPFLIHVPETWIKEFPEKAQALRKNQKLLGANIDIVPTLVDFMGTNEFPENKAILDQLIGFPLTREIPKDRVVVSLNSNDVKKFVKEGFGVYVGSKRFVHSDVEGPQYFDISNDPQQKIDLWPDVDESERNKILKIINDRKHLKRIYSNYKEK